VSTSNPRVTIIMTHYNNPRMAEEGLASILSQTFPHWELRFYDDGSVERPELPEDPRIIPTWGPDLPIAERKAKARYAVWNNVGLMEARGDLVTYLTHDDLYFPDRLERMVRFMDENPGCNTCYGPQELRFWENERWVTRGLRVGPTLVLDPLNVLDHDQVMHRAAVGRVAGGWPEEGSFWRNSDGHFFRRCVQHGGPIRRVPGFQPTDVHRFHSGSVTDMLNTNELEKAFHGR
jgi:glycosyltransferase involved in cell wall biosynthesis